MLYGLYHSAAGMLVNEYRQDIIANNIANADTTGFKRDLAVFAERTPARDAGVRNGAGDPLRDPLSGGLWLAETLTDYRTGPMQRTGRGLDVALEGPGFFVTQVDGEERVTRDGRFVTNAGGQLVFAVDGAPILGVGGAPIFLNPTLTGEQSVAIDEEGTITQNGTIVGRLAVVDFADYSALRKVGHGRWTTADSESQPALARVRSGFLENSTVQPVSEMVNLMSATRAYQLNAQMLTLQDQSLGRLISVVAAA